MLYKIGVFGFIIKKEKVFFCSKMLINKCSGDDEDSKLLFDNYYGGGCLGRIINRC